MKTNNLWIIVTLITFGLFAFVGVEKHNDLKAKHDFTKVLIGAKSYTLAVAEAMPADKFNFKASDSVKSFGEQMAHIALSTEMMVNLFIKGEKMNMDPAQGAAMEKKVGASKDACIKAINKSFDNAINTLEHMSDTDLNEKFEFFFIPEKPKFTKKAGYALIRDHITHHRGQAIVYLRIQGIKPPDYRPF